MRRLITALSVLLFVSPAATKAQAQSQSVVEDSQPAGTRFLCRFTDGPRAGRTQQLSGSSDRVIIRIGSSCSDGISSSGVITAPPAGDEARAPQAALTWTCQLLSGPHAGEVADLAAVSGAAPVPVGSACSDGASSTGTAIIAPADAATIPWSSAKQGTTGAEGPVGTICQFMSGPKAHGWHDYAPLPAAPLGSPCRDGVSSAGIVMASGHGQPY
jgi:hypothetical protein